MESAMVGPLLMLSAAVLFTLMSTLVKLMPQGYTAWHLGFVRCFGGMVVLLVFFTNKKNPYQGHNVPLLILRGATGATAFFCFGYGRTHPAHLNGNCYVLFLPFVCRPFRNYDV